MDKTCISQDRTQAYHPGHRQFGESGAWRAGGRQSTTAIWMHVLSPLVLLQPVWRLRRGGSQTRQRPQRPGRSSYNHPADTRRNIPTAEVEPAMDSDKRKPITLEYERSSRNTDLDPQLVWRRKDEQDQSDLVVTAPPIFIQEKVHPRVLIEDLLRQSSKETDSEAEQLDLFSDFNGLEAQALKSDYYEHEQNWSNRMILGDSLQVMASLASREGYQGKVQCIYMDPPYGISFNSNFQWYRDVVHHQQWYRQQKRRPNQSGTRTSEGLSRHLARWDPFLPYLSKRPTHRSTRALIGLRVHIRADRRRKRTQSPITFGRSIWGRKLCIAYSISNKNTSQSDPYRKCLRFHTLVRKKQRDVKVPQAIPKPTDWL